MMMMMMTMTMIITGGPATTNAKSGDSMFESYALHLHEPRRLQLRLWMVLWITYAGLHHHCHHQVQEVKSEKCIKSF